MTAAELYQSHGHLVLRRAYRFLGDEQDARDVLQDVFLEVIRDQATFQGRSSMTTWLYSVTTHLCLNRLRNRRSRARLLAVKAPPDRSAPPRAEDLVMATELLARLPEELATAAIYLHCDEMTHEEVAGLLGCSRQRVGDMARRIEELMVKEATPCSA